MVVRLGRVLAAFLLKKRAEYRRYWLDLTVGFVIKFIFFLGTLYASPIQTGQEAVVRLFGFSLWYLSSHVVSKLGNTALEEAYLGTTEQVLSTRTKLWQLLFGLVIAEILLSLGLVAVFLGASTVIMGVPSLWSGMDPIAVQVIIFTILGLLGMIGLGLLILGLSLRYKQVGAITEAILYYFLIFSGFFLDPEFLPQAVHLLNVISPLAWAVEGMRNGWSILVPALLVSGVWILVGIIVLKWQWNWARRAGRLGSYF